ncbi:MAG: hypothetical protein ACC656_11605, partial [Candidatus Heimdallarchaeota archaeon]
PSQQMEPGEPPAPMEQIEDEETRNEIYKRRVSNYLTSGAAISTHRIVHMPGYRDRLNQISPDLVQQYDQLLKLNEILDGAIPIEEQERMWREMPEGMAGSVKVEWPQQNEVEESNEIEQTDELTVQFEDENVEVDMPLREEERDVPDSGDPIIHARGIDFPMLVHETVKGVYELIMANGIPEDEELAQIVINNADTYMQELIGHRVGPQLRQDLLEYINQHEASNNYPNLLERVIGRIINLSGTEFLALTNGILNRTLVTKGYIDELIEEIIQELQDYSLYQQFGEDSDYEESFSEDETIESQSEPKTPTVSKSDVPTTDLDYSNMSKIELQAEMDKVLDSENWVEAKIIGNYLKKFL